MDTRHLFKTLLNKRWLTVSLIANIALLIACLFFYSKLTKTYVEYRHFRALAVGQSNATVTEPIANSVVLFGDSRIEYWWPEPQFDNYTYINAGVAGETTTEMRRRFEHDVIRLNPDIVVFQAGVNDLTAAVTKGIQNSDLLVNSVQENMHYFIKTLKDNDIEVVVTSILPTLHLNPMRKMLWHDRLTTEVDNANQKLKETTLQLGAQWFDLDPFYLNEQRDPIKRLFADTLHLNHRGYKVLNKKIKEYIDRL